MKAVEKLDKDRTTQMHFGSYQDVWQPTATWNDGGGNPFLVVRFFADGRGAEFYLDRNSAEELVHVISKALCERPEGKVTNG